MRPRVRSYGESSTRTRSPGRIRMKFIRSLPEMWANTRWPFSSSTANMVFGSGSRTVPSTSIASRLATGGAGSLSRDKCRPAGPTHERAAYQVVVDPGNPGPDRGEDRGAVPGHGDRVLEVRGERAVCGDHRPVVRHDLDVAATQREHGLNGQAHAGLEFHAPIAGSVVRDLGILVHLGSDAVPHELVDDPVAGLLADVLHGGRDVPDSISGHCCRDTGHHGQPGCRHEPQDLIAGVTDDERSRRIAMPAVDDCTDIDRHDLAVTDDPIPGD